MTYIDYIENFNFLGTLKLKVGPNHLTHYDYMVHFIDFYCKEAA